MDYPKNNAQNPGSICVISTQIDPGCLLFGTLFVSTAVLFHFAATADERDD